MGLTKSLHTGRYTIEPGKEVRLADFDPNDTSGFEGKGDDEREETKKLYEKLRELPFATGRPLGHDCHQTASARRVCSPRSLSRDLTYRALSPLEFIPLPLESPTQPLLFGGPTMIKWVKVERGKRRGSNTDLRRPGGESSRPGSVCGQHGTNDSHACRINWLVI